MNSQNYDSELVKKIADPSKGDLILIAKTPPQLQEVARQVTLSNPSNPQSSVYQRKDFQVTLYHARQVAHFLELVNVFLRIS